MLTTKKQAGFTIVELLIVIIVIAILATLVITAYNGVQAKARDAKRETDFSTLKKALEIFHAENGGYPDCHNGVYQPGGTLQVNTVQNCLTDKLAPKYFPDTVKDPINSGNYQYEYAVGYHKTGPEAYAGNQSDNYIIGARLETSGAPSFSWGSLSLNSLIGSDN